jgi:pimeloyl-ACP methyl ester carboxylesterase
MSLPRTLAVGAISTAAAAWELQRRVDRRRAERDPQSGVLNAPVEGRPVEVVSADGTKLHAEVFGPEDAPTIVLAHGWTCSIRFWTHQVQDLSRDLRVVAYDLRGHGRSGLPADPDYSTEAFAADLDAVLRTCVPDGERAVVAGHSLGAMTLVAWAGAHADEVEDRLAAAALVNTGLGDLVSESLLLRTPARLDSARQVAGRVLLSASAPLPKVPTPVSSRIVSFVTLGPDATPAQMAFCERMVLECRREARAGCGGTLSRLDLYEALESLTVPTAVIAGERDRLTPPELSRRLAEPLPRLVSLDEVPRSGHMSPIEAPEQVSETLRGLARDHLAQARQAAAA